MAKSNKGSKRSAAKKKGSTSGKKARLAVLSGAPPVPVPRKGRSGGSPGLVSPAPAATPEAPRPTKSKGKRLAADPQTEGTGALEVSPLIWTKLPGESNPAFARRIEVQGASLTSGAQSKKARQSTGKSGIGGGGEGYEDEDEDEEDDPYGVDSDSERSVEGGPHLSPRESINQRNNPPTRNATKVAAVSPPTNSWGADVSAFDISKTVQGVATEKLAVVKDKDGRTFLIMSGSKALLSFKTLQPYLLAFARLSTSFQRFQRFVEDITLTSKAEEVYDRVTEQVTGGGCDSRYNDLRNSADAAGCQAMSSPDALERLLAMEDVSLLSLAPAGVTLNSVSALIRAVTTLGIIQRTLLSPALSRVAAAILDWIGKMTPYQFDAGALIFHVQEVLNAMAKRMRTDAAQYCEEGCEGDDNFREHETVVAYLVKCCGGQLSPRERSLVEPFPLTSAVLSRDATSMMLVAQRYKSKLGAVPNGGGFGAGAGNGKDRHRALEESKSRGKAKAKPRHKAKPKAAAAAEADSDEGESDAAPPAPKKPAARVDEAKQPNFCHKFAIHSIGAADAEPCFRGDACRFAHEVPANKAGWAAIVNGMSKRSPATQNDLKAKVAAMV